MMYVIYDPADPVTTWGGQHDTQGIWWRERVMYAEPFETREAALCVAWQGTLVVTLEEAYAIEIIRDA